MNNYSHELQTAIDAAKKGADVALQYYNNSSLYTEYKDDHSPVTQADRESEVAIKSHIQSVFPDTHFLAEESGGETDMSDLWIIDPIDGTSSFRRGINGWYILISYAKDGEVILGVCYSPVTKEILYAEKGKGAFLDDKRVHVSPISDLSQAYLGYSNPKHFKNPEALLTLLKSCQVARSPEPTYAEYLLTLGKYDAVVDVNAKAWDTTALKIIIEEAGGKVTNLQGNDWTLKDMGFIATNSLLHDEVVTLVNKTFE